MMSDERLAAIRAWFNDAHTANISDRVLTDVNDLLADADEARRLLREALAYLRSREWVQATHIGGGLLLWCEVCQHLQGTGHAADCPKAAAIARLEAALSGAVVLTHDAEAAEAERRR